MRNLNHTLKALLLLFADQLLHAGDAPAQLVDPTVMMETVLVSETRTSLVSPVPFRLTMPGLNLVVKPATRQLPPDAFIRGLILTKATDNLGNSYGPIPYSRTSIAFLTSETQTIRLPGVARKATELTLIEGAIEYCQPTEANGGVIRIPNIRSHAGRIEHPVLTQYGITFQFITDKGAWDEALESPRGGGVIPSGFNVSSSPDFIGFVFRDASFVLLDATLQDRTGSSIADLGSRTISTGLPSSQSRVQLILHAPLADDTQLVIRLAVPAAITTRPFRIEHMPLY